MPAVAGHVSTGSGNLNIENPGTYRIADLNVGGISWRRMTAKSPYQHGEFLIGAVKDAETGVISIRSYGSDVETLEANVAALLDAFSQFTYHVSVTIDGVVHEWSCEPADAAMNQDQGFDKFAQEALQQLWTFRFPRSPIPIYGSY